MYLMKADSSAWSSRPVSFVLLVSSLSSLSLVGFSHSMSSLVLACSGTFDIAAPVNVATLEFLIQTVALNFWLGLATALFGPKLAV